MSLRFSRPPDWRLTRRPLPSHRFPRRYLPGIFTLGVNVGVFYRYQDASNHWRAFVNTARQVILQKVIAGVVTTAGSASWTVASATEPRVVIQGNRHRVYLGHKLLIDVTDSAMNTNTKVGPYSKNTTTVVFDDFAAQGI